MTCEGTGRGLSFPQDVPDEDALNRSEEREGESSKCYVLRETVPWGKSQQKRTDH